jgi:hypothetical protein
MCVLGWHCGLGDEGYFLDRQITGLQPGRLRYSQSLRFLLGFAMPTILRIGGLRVTIYPNDHPPPHVHVIGAKGEAVFLLNCPSGPAELRENFGFNGPEIRRMTVDLLAHVPTLCAQWGTIRGNL